MRIGDGALRAASSARSPGPQNTNAKSGHTSAGSVSNLCTRFTVIVDLCSSHCQLTGILLPVASFTGVPRVT